MSIAPSLTARDMCHHLISAEASCAGGVQPAERSLARRLGVSVYTLRNLARGGLKRVCVDLFARLYAEHMRRLTLDLQRAEHELACARAIGLDPRSPEFRALEAAAAASKAVMEGK